MASQEAHLSSLLESLGLAKAPHTLLEAAEVALIRHGDVEAGLCLLDRLPTARAMRMDLDVDAPSVEFEPGQVNLFEVERILRELGPWRKGPFRVVEPGRGQFEIDAEWRSDQKWRRLLGLGVSLRGKRVLDVGTGNGYFLLRLLGAGAREAVGLEPSLRSILQFAALRRYFPVTNCSLVPLRLEDLPPGNASYDTVMSMGVLYHQRSPLEHIKHLSRLLQPGGDLILETIAMTSAENLHIAAGERYAGMRNVYVLPTVETVRAWLALAGCEVIGASAVTLTTSAEQRKTAWSEGPSLEDVLEPTHGDADDPGRRTCEDHPRPARIVLWARRIEEGP